MVWSYSGSRAFRRCQRQWFIKHHYANALAKKDPLRREAYLLSTLQSPYAWRGSLVDTVISKHVVPALLWSKRVPTAADLIREARLLFDKQVEFALHNRAWEPGMTKTKAGDDFAALHPVVYEGEVSEEILEQMWNDISQSLINFKCLSDLIDVIQSGKYWIAQRPLIFTCEGMRARMVPDLIVFFQNEPPLIIDWKVQQIGEHNARQQLASYALALVGCDPHKDFPASLMNICATDIQLIEAQLLIQQQRVYSLTDADVESAISYIVQSHSEIELATMGDPKSLTMHDFPAATNPQICQRCNFRAICWNQEAF